jgi:hypothetical protein
VATILVDFCYNISDLVTSLMQTLAPATLSAMAIGLPIPELAPVTMASGVRVDIEPPPAASVFADVRGDACAWHDERK